MSLSTLPKVQKLQDTLHAKASVSSLSEREPDAGNPHVRFDERDVETEQGWNLVTLADERASQQGIQTPT